MHSRERACWRLTIGVVLAAAVMAGVCAQALGQSEKEIVEKARIKLKLKEYDEAQTMLEEAAEKYPSSVEVAKARTELYEATGNTESLIKALDRLAELLRLKEVKDGSLSADESTLLKETQSKLRELIEIRLDADMAVDGFADSAVETCRKLISAKEFAGACFVYQRLRLLGEKEPELEKLAQQLGQDKLSLVCRPGESAFGDTEQAAKLVIEARESFKSGNNEEALISCKAALQADPYYASALALLCDIADKMGNKQDMLVSGLSYLLMPVDAQDARQAEGLERRISRASEELKDFFAAAKKAAAKLCSLAAKAVREKKPEDQEYVLDRLVLLTHRTRKADSVLAKAKTSPRTASKPRKTPKKRVKIGRVLYSDDFSTPSNRWYVRDGYAFFEKGEFFVKSDLDSPMSSRLGDPYSDVYAQTEIRCVGTPKAGRGGGLCIRARGSNNFYFFAVSADGKFGLWVVNNGFKKDLTGKDKSGPSDMFCCVPCKYLRRGSEKNLIAIAIAGSKLFCYINEELVFTGEDNALTDGTTGFMVNKGNCMCAFDNFKACDVSLAGK